MTGNLGFSYRCTSAAGDSEARRLRQTNAQIAAHLCVSIRTLEAHLYHAFAKLGITDRTQLAGALEGEV